MVTVCSIAEHCKFLKSIKLEANFILAMDFVTVELFSYDILYLVCCVLLESTKLNKLANNL